MENKYITVVNKVAHSDVKETKKYISKVVGEKVNKVTCRMTEGLYKATIEFTTEDNTAVSRLIMVEEEGMVIHYLYDFPTGLWEFVSKQAV
ncbi:hypothetical protein [Clostridium felsineum]|uniref:hypothetical protein n=1 Tax=Clostridium felsineum TaxID=36839 RepID=UPI00098C89DC|nr:hypothetical protein [Clostridium felsineum]URZ16879.1 hypothetical protein CLFE_029260 [Clostridium felsineum DSM 794]